MQTYGRNGNAYRKVFVYDSAQFCYLLWSTLAYGTEACEGSGTGHERGEALAITEWRVRSSNLEPQHHVTVANVLEYLAMHHCVARQRGRAIRCLRWGATDSAYLYLLLAACDLLVHSARRTATPIRPMAMTCGCRR
jgi:hypothetical protein